MWPCSVEHSSSLPHGDTASISKERPLPRATLGNPGLILYNLTSYETCEMVFVCLLQSKDTDGKLTVEQQAVSYTHLLSTYIKWRKLS